MHVWGIDNFVIRSDIFRAFFICKNILNKIIVLPWQLLYYEILHVRKIQWFLSARRGVSACMYFLVYRAYHARN
jgi:hypothetical protein